MDIETALKALTLGNATIAAAIGQRYYIDRIPGDVTTYPLTRAQTVSDIPMDAHGSNVGGRALIQLDIYDDDKATCNTTTASVKGWLHRYQGAFGSGSATIKVSNTRSIAEPDTKLFRQVLEVSILYFTV